MFSPHLGIIHTIVPALECLIGIIALSIYNVKVMKHILSTSLSLQPASPGMLTDQLSFRLKLTRPNIALKRIPESEDEIIKNYGFTLNFSVVTTQKSM